MLKQHLAEVGTFFWGEQCRCIVVKLQEGWDCLGQCLASASATLYQMDVGNLHKWGTHVMPTHSFGLHKRPSTDCLYTKSFAACQCCHLVNAFVMCRFWHIYLVFLICANRGLGWVPKRLPLWTPRGKHYGPEAIPVANIQTPLNQFCCGFTTTLQRTTSTTTICVQ